MDPWRLYLESYNPLENQLEYDSRGNITKFIAPPKNQVDLIAAEHDVCYAIGRNKGDCDREMVKKISELPYEEVSKIGMLARNSINAKERLGFGLKKYLETEIS